MPVQQNLRFVLLVESRNVSHQRLIVIGALKAIILFFVSEGNFYFFFFFFS